MQRFGPSNIVRSKSQSTGFLLSPSGWQHSSFHMHYWWFLTIHIKRTIFTTLWAHSTQFVLWSFVFLTFLSLSSFSLEISPTPRRGKKGKETDRDVVHHDFSLSPIVLALCCNYLSDFCLKFLRSLSNTALFHLAQGSTMLLCANCFLNPIFYTLRMPGFRRALKILCRQQPQPHRQVQIIPLREINPQNWFVLMWEKWTFKKILWR